MVLRLPLIPDTLQAGAPATPLLVLRPEPTLSTARCCNRENLTGHDTFVIEKFHIKNTVLETMATNESRKIFSNY